MLIVTVPMKGTTTRILTIFDFLKGVTSQTVNQIFVYRDDPRHEIEFEVERDNVELWWPNGYGSQKLYELNVESTTGGEISSRLHRKVGFRTVKIVENLIGDDRGRTFYFEVNGEPIFAMGSNW